MILRNKVSLTTSLFAWLITPSERLATKALVGISEVVEAFFAGKRTSLESLQKMVLLEFGIMSFSFQFSWFLRFLPIVPFFWVCVCFFDPTIRPTTSWGWHWHWVANKILCQIWAVSQTGTCLWSYKVRLLKSWEDLRVYYSWYIYHWYVRFRLLGRYSRNNAHDTSKITPYKRNIIFQTPQFVGTIPNTIGIHLSNELHSAKSLVLFWNPSFRGLWTNPYHWLGEPIPRSRGVKFITSRHKG